MFKPLKISEVRQHTGRRMTVEDAAKFVSPNQARQITRNQARALSTHTWNNTSTDWLRLEACLVLLHRRAPSPKPTAVRRVDIKAILADPLKRDALMDAAVDFICKVERIR